MNDQMADELVNKYQFNMNKDGRLQFIVGLCEKIGLPEIFNKHLGKENEAGRYPLLPPGIEALIMVAGICTQGGYRSIYAIKDFYAEKDVEGIFRYPIERSSLTDDRFGDFLDAFHDAGCRKIFLEVCDHAFAIIYGQSRAHY